MAALATVALALASGTAHASVQPSTETLVEIRVHGNFSIPDDDVLALAGVAVGDAVGPTLVDDVARRLEASGRFEAVDIRKRFRSLRTTDDVALILVVRERAAAMSANPVMRSLGELGRHTMFLPVLAYDEGYGFTYGARTSFVDVLGTDGRLSVPATWGGTKRLALEAEKLFGSGLVDRVQTGASLSRREHPHFAREDDRSELWVSADRRLPAHFGIGARATWSDVRFGELDDRLTRYGVTLDFDTRVDPAFPRDAVFASAGFQWLHVSGRTAAIGRPRLDVRGFKGTYGQTVLAVRAVYEGADRALPPYEQTLLGGGGTLRGWKVGELVGDRMAAGSIELRLPMSSPLSVGKAGFTLFFDTGTAYPVGQSIRKQKFRKGAGAGVFLQCPTRTAAPGGGAQLHRRGAGACRRGGAILKAAGTL